MATNSVTRAPRFVAIQGRWRFKSNTASFIGPDARQPFPVGVCLAPISFRSGVICAKVRLVPETEARIVAGYSASTGGYYSVGLGGHGFAYSVYEFLPAIGWQVVEGRGDASQLLPEHDYELRVEIRGQQVSLSVDSVRVIQTSLRAPLPGDQVGLLAWGEKEVYFSEFSVSGVPPQVFVVMQFGEPYDSLYHDVIQPVAHDVGFAALRADDVFRPGVILQDIRRGIVESDVIVAEITPANPNVFYELGYAHALDKPTVLLANRKTEKLPFDVSGYRVIFYDDTIGGKRDIESTLHKHLESIRRGQSDTVPA